ncbi:unnamed protein product [Leptosia nina]|uniref:Uncharacterized protein n=1 Tax=Leptosia nina TaxID=320188 RepID=A0AAV1J5C3_9NEOP
MYSLLLSAASVIGVVLIGITAILIYKCIFEPRAGVCRCTTRLDGKIVIITGANRGIGFETAKDLAKRGARVIIADVQNADDAVAKIVKETGNTAVEYKHLDLARFKSIQDFMEKVKDIPHLDILVNNAAIATMKDQYTEDGINCIMHVNYFGPFILTALLLDKLVASKSSRIVIMASAAHCYANFDINDLIGAREMLNFKHYANSKLCNVLWMKALAKRLPKNVTANSIHPGIVKTPIYNHFYMRRIFLFMVNIFFKSPRQGAQTTIHVCVAEELEHSSGSHYADCKEKNVSQNGRNDSLVEEVWCKTITILEDRNLGISAVLDKYLNKPNGSVITK